MKKQFREHYTYTNSEIRKIWNKCIFVFDTNTLLNMYRYKEKTTKEYFDVLTELRASKRIFLPYQVGQEFFDRRMEVINEYSKSYDEVLSQFDKFKMSVEKKYSRHPYIDFKDLADQVEKALEPIVKSIERSKKSHPDLIENDVVLGRLTKIFDGLTGERYSDSELQSIFQEGELRYKANTPPGYKDSAKGGTRQYGDLVIWKEMIDLAKIKKVPIVFISGDVKEDWWQIFEGKRIMPHPLLKREMLDQAGTEFHIYTADRFLSYYKELSNNSIGDDAIDEVKKIREIDELRAQRNLLAHTKVMAGYDQMPIDEAVLIELMLEYEKMANTLDGLSSEQKSTLNNLYSRARFLLRRTKNTRAYSPAIHKRVTSIIDESALLMYRYQNTKRKDDMNSYDEYENTFTQLNHRLEKLTWLNNNVTEQGAVNEYEDSAGDDQIS